MDQTKKFDLKNQFNKILSVVGLENSVISFLSTLTKYDKKVIIEKLAKHAGEICILKLPNRSCIFVYILRTKIPISIETLNFLGYLCSTVIVPFTEDNQKQMYFLLPKSAGNKTIKVCLGKNQPATSRVKMFCKGNDMVFSCEEENYVDGHIGSIEREITGNIRRGIKDLLSHYSLVCNDFASSLILISYCSKLTFEEIEKLRNKIRQENAKREMINSEIVKWREKIEAIPQMIALFLEENIPNFSKYKEVYFPQTSHTALSTDTVKKILSHIEEKLMLKLDSFIKNHSHPSFRQSLLNLICKRKINKVSAVKNNPSCFNQFIKELKSHFNEQFQSEISLNETKVKTIDEIIESAQIQIKEKSDKCLLKREMPVLNIDKIQTSEGKLVLTVKEKEEGLKCSSRKYTFNKMSGDNLNSRERLSVTEIATIANRKLDVIHFYALKSAVIILGKCKDEFRVVIVQGADYIADIKVEGEISNSSFDSHLETLAIFNRIDQTISFFAVTNSGRNITRKAAYKTKTDIKDMQFIYTKNIICFVDMSNTANFLKVEGTHVVLSSKKFFLGPNNGIICSPAGDTLAVIIRGDLHTCVLVIKILILHNKIFRLSERIISLEHSVAWNSLRFHCSDNGTFLAGFNNSYCFMHNISFFPKFSYLKQPTASTETSKDKFENVCASYFTTKLKMLTESTDMRPGSDKICVLDFHGNGLSVSVEPSKMIDMSQPHIIFFIDKSKSMALKDFSPSWPSEGNKKLENRLGFVFEKVLSLVKNRRVAGVNEVFSVVLFDNETYVVKRRSHLVGFGKKDLEKVEPNNGTNFQIVFEEAKRLMVKGCKNKMIFLSDGAGLISEKTVTDFLSEWPEMDLVTMFVGVDTSFSILMRGLAEAKGNVKYLNLGQMDWENVVKEVKF